MLNEEDVTDINAEISGPGKRCRGEPACHNDGAFRSRQTGCPRPASTDQTPFACGVFKVKLVLPSDFPHAPPKGRHTRATCTWRAPCVRMCFTARNEPSTLAGYFLTKIYHPNVSKSGEICVNTLKRDWQSSLGIGHVLQVRPLARFARFRVLGGKLRFHLYHARPARRWYGAY